MKKKDIQDLRNKDVQALLNEVQDKKFELAKTFSEMKVSGEKDIKKSRKLRDEIAKIMTIIREKQILEEMEGVK